MAVVAKFVGDFSSFTAAVEQAERNLVDLDKGANKASASLSKMVDSFSGRKIVQDAITATEAVERIGGTSKLTANELKAVQTKAVEAAAKLRAMGLDVPPGIQKIADTAKASTFSLDGMKTALIGALSVGAITAAVGKFTELTGSLTDMAAKTGISTTELQKLKFAAEQNGGSLDQVTGGIAKMGKALVEGKDSTVEAMKRLGLSINEVRTMAPGEAFTTIADKIAQIPSPLERSKLAMDLFGKSGADLLPMMTGHLSETAAAAEKLGIVLDEETVAAGDNFGDTLTSLQSVGMAILGKVIKPMLPALQALAEMMLGAGKVVDYLRDMFDALMRVALIAFKGIIDGLIKVGEMTGKIPGLNTALGVTKDVLAGARDASVWLGGAIKGLESSTTTATVATKAHRTEVGLLTEEDKKATKAKHEKVQATQEEIHALELLKIAHDHQAAQLKFEQTAYEATQKAAGAYIAALPSAIFQTQSFAGAMSMVSAEAATFQGNLANAGQSIQTFWQQLLSVQPETVRNVAIQGVDHLVGALGDAIGTGDWSRIKDALRQAFVKVAGAAIAAGVDALVPGLGTLLKPIFEGIANAFVGLFDRNKGRDIVQSFADSLGGFDALHKQLNELGAEGERLWIKLTQGVGRNNKDQARAAVDEVTAALEKHKAAQQEVTKAVAEADAAQTAAYTKAKDAVDSLDSQIKTLSDSIAGEAPEEFMGIVEQQTRARIAGLTKERDAAQKSLEDLGKTMTDSIDRVADAIKDLPKDIEIHLKPYWDSTGSVPSGAAGGGVVGSGRVLPFARGGLVPGSTDTVPAMLTPGEIILNAAQQQRLGQQLAGQPLTITVPVYLDSEQIGEGLVRMAKRKGLR